MFPVLSSSKLSAMVPRRKSLLTLIPSLAESFFVLLGSEIILIFIMTVLKKEASDAIE